MANLPESPTYDAGVYQLETTDPVLGGINGVSNSPLKNLANRTTYLKQHLDNLEAGTTIPPGVAPINSPTFTGDPKVPTAAAADNDTSIASTAFVQRRHRGLLIKDVSGNTNVSLTSDELGYGIIRFNGILTGNINVIFPDETGRWLVHNQTSGSFSLLVKNAATPGISVAQNKSREVWSGGATMFSGESDFENVSLAGISTAPTASLGSNTTQIANAAFLQSTVYGRLTKSVGGGSTTTLTAVEAGNGILVFTGALTANKSVVVPTNTKSWIVLNSTTGNFALTLKTSAGTGVVLPRDESVFAYCDGTNVLLAGSANQNSFVYDHQVATGGQTVFSIQYTPGSLLVFQNGGLLEQDEYTAANGSSVVLDVGATAGDDLVFYALKSFEVADALMKSANLSDLPNAAAARDNLDVLQKSANLSDLPSPSVALTNIGGFPKAGGTIDGDVIVAGGELAVHSQTSGSNPNVYLRDDVGNTRGRFYWSRSTNDVRIERWDGSGATEGVLVLFADRATYNANEILTAGSTGRIRTAYKPADTARGTQTSPTPDPDLQIAGLDFNSTYKIEGFFEIENPGTTDGTKVTFVRDNSSGAFTDVAWNATTGYLTSVEGDHGTLGTIATLAGSDTATLYVKFSGFIVTGASGTPDWEVPWAQSTSSATATVFRKGSWIRAEKLN